MYIIDHKIPKYLYKFRDKILEDYLGWLELNYNKITDNKLDLATKSVNCFVLNINNALLSGKNSMVITLREDSYSKSFIINGKDTKRKVSYRYTRSLFDFLNIKNYGDLTIGGEVEEWGMISGVWKAIEHSRSIFKYNTKLKELYNYNVKKKGFDPLNNVVTLRWQDTKIQKTFKMGSYEKGVRDFLKEYNKFSRDKLVMLDEVRLDTQIYKVYTENFKQGGRSHMNCSYQQESSSKRKKVTIDDKPTVCYDYKGFEPSIAYSMNQEIMEMEDPYQIPSLVEYGYEKRLARKLAKVAIIISLNTDSKDIAKKAINKELALNLDVPDLYKKGYIPNKTISVEHLLESVIDYHYMIGDMFFTEKGLQVQNVGSAINDYILEYMMQHHKQLVIQVHDDFTVVSEYEDILKDVMEKAYEHVLGFSDNCRITKEP